MNVHMHFGYRALRVAAVFGLLALALMVWGVVDPSPIALFIAMSLGQVLGTLSFAVFCLVVLNDLRRSRIFSSAPPPLSEEPAEGPPEPP